MSKVVVIGANHAGTATINTILDNYEGYEVEAFDANSNISFLGCGMALWIGEQISGPSGLFYQTKEQFEAKGATIHMECPVERVDFDAKVVYARDKDGTAYEASYDKLVLATGSLPILPRFEGGDLESIQQVKLFQDAQEVVDKLEDPAIKTVAVVGAGYIGVELAEAFQRNGRHTLLVDMAPTCMANNFDPEFSEMMARNLAEHGIEAHYGEGVDHFEGVDGKVTKLVTDKGAYDVDMVCVCIGFRPNSALADSDAFEKLGNGALVVDRHQMTSVEDVYAVGDCATIFNNSLDGAPGYIALASNAVRSGIVAGHNICGTALETPGVQGSSGICIFDLKMVSTGLTESAAKRAGIEVKATTVTGPQKAPFIEHDNPDATCKIVYDAQTRAILGAQIASTYDMHGNINLFSLAVEKKVTIDELKLLDIFFLPHFNAPYNYITMAALQAE